MTRRLLFIALIGVVAAGALEFRLPGLALRPMHTDEAVNAVKTGLLFDQGFYRYDPFEYHGPTLYYFTLPLLWLSPYHSYAETGEAVYRLAPVAFGVGLILLLLLAGDGFGRPAALCAGVLTAISPAMVFYSRYYIMEMLLVFFTFGAIAAGWRYAWSKRIGWAILAGVFVGLMQATKETAVIAYAAMGLAIYAKVRWRRWWGYPIRIGPLINPRHLAAALAAAIVTAGLLFSSFFANPHGLVDAVRTYAIYLDRGAGGPALHNHPWHYYLKMLVFTQHMRGPWWTEGLILVLAAVGFVSVMVKTSAPEARAPLVRFVAFYTLFLTAAYSILPYKTPWCLLSFLHGMILLAGVGAVVLVELVRTRLARFSVFFALCLLAAYWLFPARTLSTMSTRVFVSLIGLLATAAVILARLCPTRPAQAATCLLLATAACNLAGQAYRQNFKFHTDPRNPYVYAHTSPDLVHLAERVEEIAQVAPEHRDMIIKVVAPESDYWPLPWYLRRFPNVGYWTEAPDEPNAAMIIVGSEMQEAVEANLGGLYHQEFRGLRPGIHLIAYVRQDLWDAFLKTVEKAGNGGR